MAKSKALISCAVTAQLICAFGFAYADCWFSHALAHVIIFCDHASGLCKIWFVYFVPYIPLNSQADRFDMKQSVKNV